MNMSNSAVREGTIFPAAHPLLLAAGLAEAWPKVLATLQLPVAKVLVKLMVMRKLH